MNTPYHLQDLLDDLKGWHIARDLPVPEIVVTQAVVVLASGYEKSFCNIDIDGTRLDAATPGELWDQFVSIKAKLPAC